MYRNPALISVAALAIVLTSCATKPPPPVKEANPKTGTYEEKTLTFGGRYLVDKKALTITVNGDAVLAGSFPIFTPKLNLKTKYEGLNIEADCYFGSVLTSSLPGPGSIIAGIAQGQEGVSADACEIFVQGVTANKLYFQLVNS